MGQSKSIDAVFKTRSAAAKRGWDTRRRKAAYAASLPAAQARVAEARAAGMNAHLIGNACVIVNLNQTPGVATWFPDAVCLADGILQEIY